MHSLAQFSSLVGDIYDCVAEPQRWQATLQRICSHFDGIIATLGILDTTNNSTRFGAACGPPEIVNPLITTYAADMPFYHVIPRMEIDVPVAMDTICDFVGPGAREALNSSRLGREWSIPNKISDCLCLAIIKQADRVGTLVINTTTERRPISQADLDQLAVLAPHLRRAVTIGDLFETRASETHVYRNLLQQLAVPILIVASDMRVVFCNASAEAQLRSGEIATLQQERLVFANPLANNSIARAVQLSVQREYALGSMGIGVPTGAQGGRTFAHVLPLACRTPSSRLDAQAAAAIFLPPPSGVIIPAVDALAALFGLTPAEKRVALQVADGKTRSAIAAAHSVTDGTVKSQLDAIYTKTETANQRQLQSLIQVLTPPANFQ